MMMCVLWTCGTTKRASAADGVDAPPVRTSDIEPVPLGLASAGDGRGAIRGAAHGDGGSGAQHDARGGAPVAVRHERRRRPQAPSSERGWGDYLPSSNTTSRLTETLLSPVATGVLSISAFIAMVRIIGIGRTPPPLPSEMLTMRRTRRPSALA